MTRFIKVNIITTDNHPSRSDLFVEIDDITSKVWKPINAFASIKAAAKWLEDEGFKYVQGSNGIWINDTSTARKNAPAEYRDDIGGRRIDEAGIVGEQQQAFGVRRLAVKLGRMGATLRPGPGSVAGDQRGEAAN